MENISKLRIALFEPRIPQNTGNIARTCAAFNLPLDLIQPLGFSLEDRYLKRAGLDYWKYLDISIYSNFEEYHRLFSGTHRFISTSKIGKNFLGKFTFHHNDIIIFGREDNGLPKNIKDISDEVITIPMPGGTNDLDNLGVRSLNLSVSVGIITFQATNQLGLTI